MLHVQCDNCGAMAFTERHEDPDADFDAKTSCSCCKKDHHHGNAATADLSAPACRPLTITVVPGSVHLRAGGGE